MPKNYPAFLHGLVFALGLYGALFDQAKADPIPATPADMWKRVLDATSYEEVLKTYEVLGDLQDESGNTLTDRCAQAQSQLDSAVRANPVSLALRAASADCALATGNELAAERHTRAFADLVRYAVADLPADDGETPIEVLAEADVVAFVRASGAVPIGYFYYFDSSSEFPLSLRVDVFDKERGTERWLSFDYIKSVLHFLRPDPDSRFPPFRQMFVASVIDNWGGSEGSIRAEAYAVQMALKRTELDDRLQEMARLGALENLGAVYRYATYCLYLRSAACEATATDLLLPWAEIHSARAMIMLAVLKADPAAARPDEKSARILLDAADRRLGNHAASAEFAQIIHTRNRGGKLATFARKRLQSAMQAGNPKAAWLLALRERDRENPQNALPKKVRLGLVSAAQSGFPRAEALFASVLLAEGNRGEAIRWTKAAAAHHAIDAQRWLGLAYADGLEVDADAEKAVYWNERAANNGNVQSMLWLADHYRSGVQSSEARQLREGWLLSATANENVDAGVALADLYREGGEGLKAGPAGAEKIYRVVLDQHDRADARRGLASLLFGTEGVKKNPEEARRLLTADAEKGDVESQIDLGMHLLKGDLGPVDASARSWLTKAADSGNANAQYELGLVLFYNRDGFGRDVAGGIARTEHSAAQGHYQAQNNLAWFLCTADISAVRDAQRGLGVARQLVENMETSPPAWIDTLAACQAAIGNFDQAAQTEEQMAERLRKIQSDHRDIPFFEKRSQLFRSRKPYIEVVDAK